ncbi:MAG: tyrosine-type recombinase/integrase [Proteobacteria bacterium]|nr:tyrosine-type recombinase/integrase [Pseudomonadota bacterium]
MAGCRALSDEEVELVLKNFKGKYAKRNVAIFTAGIKSGFRISELLSIRVSDVMQHGQFKSHIVVEAKNMKGRKKSRCVVFHQAAKDAIAEYLAEYEAMWGRPMTPDMYLFRSQQGVNRRLSRSQVAKILHDVFDSQKFCGKLGTHVMRKTYAVRLYKIFGKDLVKTQRAMAHDNINSTCRYLQDFTGEDIDQAILSA